MSKNALYGIIAAIIVIIVIAAAIAAIYYKPTPSKPKVKNPDTFVWDEAGDPQTLDPAECYGVPGSSIIYNVYDRLVTYKGSDSKTIYPSLATDWSVDSSGKIWTFHLRKGVKFSNGDPFNAEAVKYS
ncbi:MAG: ABC transporter substrate-binding protein, partial [Thermoplasmata archaeon]|nr:ABC transporter substrate-binding protein [Thermoplasmata archaeon]